MKSHHAAEPVHPASNVPASAPVREAQAFFTRLNHEYVRVHKAKEDLFWATYMAISDDHDGFSRAEQTYKAFISSREQLESTRASIARVEAAPDAADHAPLLHGLLGWRALFEAHVIDNDRTAGLMADLVDAEAKLFAARQRHVVFHSDDRGERVEATLPMLAVNQATNPVEARRRSSYEAFRTIEHWVLEHGYLEIVALRNRFARALGYADYFDFKVRRQERMSPRDLFAIIDDFLGRTAAAHDRGLAALRARHGEGATQPWNLRFHMSGDVVREMDPYVPFAMAVRRWLESFRRLGIRFRGATLQLDLLERRGKHQNGFCHSPVPTWYDEQRRWIPGQINFTAEATPNQVGSGWRALNTLFHEGGHAAHFANVAQNAPCFSQEYAPTSAAYAETQSMLCDSLLDDADWLSRYARNRDGEAMPEALIRARLERRQPFLAFDERSLAVVSYFEAALYAMPDAARTPDAVLALARDTEARVLGGPSPRPLLAIPHLLNQESSAAYHGYLLAHMAVYQTRASLLAQAGYLTDNPAIGPQLAAHYWHPGNSVTHDETLQSLTGEGLSGRALAEACTRSVDEAWNAAREQMRAAASRTYPTDYPDSLDASIRIVHGTEVLADTSDSEERLCADFERWVAAHYPPS
jgi:oligoendopeptidase F